MAQERGENDAKCRCIEHENVNSKCLCGSVHYEVETNSATRSIVIAQNVGVRPVARSSRSAGITREARNYRWSGPPAYLGEESEHDAHCGKCGSLLYSLVRDAMFVHVTLGTLVDSPSIRPTAHIFVGSKARGTRSRMNYRNTKSFHNARAGSWFRRIATAPVAGAFRRMNLDVVTSGLKPVSAELQSVTGRSTWITGRDPLLPIVTGSYRESQLTGAFRQRMRLTAIVGFVAACARDLRSTAQPPRAVSSGRLLMQCVAAQRGGWH